MKNSTLKNEDIIFLSGIGNYTSIHFKDGSRFMSSYTLLRHEEKLPGFIRFNRKYLVNPEFIREYKSISDAQYVILRNGEQIKIPRRKTKMFV